MPHNLTSLRNMYLTKLEKSFPKKKLITIDDAIFTFDEVISDIQSSIGYLIDELVSNPKYLHFSAGKSKQKGHEYYPCVGDIKYHPDIIVECRRPFIKNKISKTKQERDAFLLRDEEVWDVYTYDFIDHQFEVLIRGSKVGQSYAFRMYWPDRTHDKRESSSAEYALLIPKDEINRIIPRVVENPEILLQTFKKTYLDCDNSNGKLKMRSGPRSVIFYDLPK